MPEEINELIFDIDTPLGISVRCTKKYWEETILKKHPLLKNHVDLVKKSLSNPLLIRKSKQDERVYLFYNDMNQKLVCVVAKNENNYGFLITAYPTNAVKEGEEVWTKLK